MHMDAISFKSSYGKQMLDKLECSAVEYAKLAINLLLTRSNEADF
jgi:hypothetical protein